MRRILAFTATLLLLASCGGRPGSYATPPPLPATQQPSASNDLLEASYAQLRQGQLAFNPPQQMHVGESAIVRLRLTRDAAVALPTLLAGLDRDRDVLTDSVKVGRTMRAQLSGDSFKVEPLSSEVQLVVGDAYNEWAWRLSPLAAGTHTLTLHISAIISIGAEKLDRDFPVKEASVSVRVGVMHMLGQVLGTSWKELLGLLVPMSGGTVGLWLWKRLRERRAKQATI